MIISKEAEDLSWQGIWTTDQRTKTEGMLTEAEAERYREEQRGLTQQIAITQAQDSANQFFTKGAAATYLLSEGMRNAKEEAAKYVTAAELAATASGKLKDSQGDLASAENNLKTDTAKLNDQLGNMTV